GWVELQVDPTSYVEHVGSLEAVVEVVLEGIDPRTAGGIVSSSWARSGAHAARPGSVAARDAGAGRGGGGRPHARRRATGGGVVGFGLSNDERRGTVADFVAAYRIAAEAGLLGVPHGGFYEGAWHVRACVETLGAHRIGHGITAAADPATVELLAARSVALEV